MDVERLLKEISPDAPCGEDISYDPGYVGLERLAQGTPDTQFQQAEEPNWKDVETRCLELAARSKHLRVLLYLALAGLRRGGIGEFRDGLAVLHGVLERYWDTVYPQLDPDDNNDPLERMNIIVALAPPTGSFNDPMKFKDRLLLAPLCGNKQIGRFSLRDILVAGGEMPPPQGTEAKQPDAGLISAAFEATDIAELQSTRQALADAVGHVKGIDRLLTEKVGAGKAPNLSGLEDVLAQALGHVDKGLERRGYGAATGGAEVVAPAGAAPGPHAGGQALSGEITSNADVIRALDKVCEYYERCEPSSPVPLLVRRARRLVGKSFMDIVRDMTPDALPHVEQLGGGAGSPAA